MNIEGKHYRTIWSDGESVFVIDQTKLPHKFEVVVWRSVEDAAHGIRSMIVRGAPLIGAAAAYGMALAMRAKPSDEALQHAYDLLVRSRPTAVNLRWALDRMSGLLKALSPSERTDAGYREALSIADEDAKNCSVLGERGLLLFSEAWNRLDQKRPIATPDGWRQSIGEPRSRQFTKLSMPGFLSTSGSTRLGPATREHR